MARVKPNLRPDGDAAPWRRRGRPCAPQHDADAMVLAVVGKGDGPCVHGVAVELGVAHPAALPLRVLDLDLVARPPESPGDGVAGPRRGDAGLDREEGAAPAQPQDA